MLFGNAVGNRYPVFDPVHFLFKTHPLHMARIIREVVDRSHGSHLVEAFDKHAFVIEVGKSHRTGDFFHPALSTPLLHGIEKLVDHFLVVDKLKPSEPELFLSGLFVVGMVDDCRYGADRLAVAESHERLRLAEIERGIRFRRKRPHIIHYQRRNVAGIVFIEIDTEFDILMQLVGIR